MGQPRIALNENHLADLAQRTLTQKVKEKAGKDVQNLIDKVLPGAKTGAKPAQGDSPAAPSPLKGLDKTLKGLFKR